MAVPCPHKSLVPGDRFAFPVKGKEEVSPWRLAIYRPHLASISWDLPCSRPCARCCWGCLAYYGCYRFRAPSVAEAQRAGGQRAKCSGEGNSMEEDWKVGMLGTHTVGRKSVSILVIPVSGTRLSGSYESFPLHSYNPLGHKDEG